MFDSMKHHFTVINTVCYHSSVYYCKSKDRTAHQTSKYRTMNKRIHNLTFYVRYDKAVESQGVVAGLGILDQLYFITTFVRFLSDKSVLFCFVISLNVIYCFLRRFKCIASDVVIHTSGLLHSFFFCFLAQHFISFLYKMTCPHPLHLYLITGVWVL